MKQMQRNALNIKTAAKQVWLYFIRRTTQPGEEDTITNVQIVLKTQKSLLQATPKNFPSQKNPGIENFEPRNTWIVPLTTNPGVPHGSPSNAIVYYY